MLKAVPPGIEDVIDANVFPKGRERDSVQGHREEISRIMKDQNDEIDRSEEALRLKGLLAKVRLNIKESKRKGADFGENSPLTVCPNSGQKWKDSRSPRKRTKKK
jgi:hypothetical protein